MRCVSLFLALLLCGCDTPSPSFQGAAAARITVGESVFDVRIADRRAEAIRLNSEWVPRLEAVAPRAMAAIEKVSGCEVRRLYGDQAMIRADLKCKGKALPAPPRQPLYCATEGAPYARGDWLVVDIVCDPPL